MNGNDEQRPLKKFRQEMAATAPVPAETKADADADANNHDLVADSNSECEQVVRQALAHGELTFHDEAAQDVSEADGIQLSFDDVVGTGALQPVDDDEVRRDARGVNGIQLQYRSAVHDGTSEIDEDYKESHPIHNSTGEVYIKRTISDNEDDENDDGGLTAPPNSDAGDEEEKEGEEDDVQDQDQDQDQTETVGNFNHDTAMTDLQEVDGEVEATDFNEEGEEEEAQAISIEDKHIRAAAMSIYEEARHSVDFARDSQAALIDTAQQGKAHVRARAKTRTERRDRLMAESEADSDISEC
jgi:hypothetical protein